MALVLVTGACVDDVDGRGDGAVDAPSPGDAPEDAPADVIADAPADVIADVPADMVAEAGVTDAGPDGACGYPGKPCCPASTCHSGCCIPSLQDESMALPVCVADGTSCGFLKGTCAQGSCVSEGVRCGSQGETCCRQNDAFLPPNNPSFCTGSRARCVLSTERRCEVCGGEGQPCCFYLNATPDECLPRSTCVGGSLLGRCERCGGVGEVCCYGANPRCEAELDCTGTGLPRCWPRDAGTD
jgi:hypothetical protein